MLPALFFLKKEKKNSKSVGNHFTVKWMIKKKDKRSVLHFDAKRRLKLPTDAMVGRQFRTYLRIEMEYKSFILFLYHSLSLLDYKMVSDRFWMIYGIAESPRPTGKWGLRGLWNLMTSRGISIAQFPSKDLDFHKQSKEWNVQRIRLLRPQILSYHLLAELEWNLSPLLILLM